CSKSPSIPSSRARGMRVDWRCASQESKRSGATKTWRQSTRSTTRGSSRPSDRTLSDGVVPPIGGTAPQFACGNYCAVPSGAPCVGVGEAPSTASGNGEMDGDAERSGVTEGLAKVSEVAGTEAAGTGLAKRPGADGRAGNVLPGARSGSVTLGGRRGTRRGPGDKLSPD